LPTIANKTVNWIFPVQLPIAKKGQEKRIANRKTKCEFARARIANFRRGRGLWGLCGGVDKKCIYHRANKKSAFSFIPYIALPLAKYKQKWACQMAKEKIA